jgi:hypothetical protein
LQALRSMAEGQLRAVLLAEEYRAEALRRRAEQERLTMHASQRYWLKHAMRQRMDRLRRLFK